MSIVLSNVFSDLGVRRQCVNDVAQASNFCNSVRDFDGDVNCKICDYDGCNGAISYSYKPIVVLIVALPMVLLKILSI